MKNATHRILAAGLAAAALLATTATSRAAAPEAGGSGAAVENLLKAAKLVYTKVGDAGFKLPYDDKDGNTTNIFIEARTTQGDSPKAFAFVWSIVLHLDGDKVPAPVLAKMAELNNRMNFGNISAEKDKDGGHTVYVNMSFFLKNAEPDQLDDYVEMNLGTRQFVRKELQHVIEEGSGEK